MNPRRALLRLLIVSLFTMFVIELGAASAGWRAFNRVRGAGIGQKLAQDGAGNIYVGGDVFPNAPNYIHSPGYINIVKYNSAGKRLWSYAYDSDATYDELSNFAVTANGQVYVAGGHYTTNWSALIFKLDSDGTLLWERTNEGFVVALGLDAIGNVFVGGYVDPEGGLRDSLLLKYTADGTKLWERRFDDAGGPVSGAYGIAVDQAGNVFVTGFKINVSKFDGEGNLLWETDYEGQNAYKVIVDSAGSAYVIGQYFDAGAILAKLAPDGEKLWQFTHKGKWNDLIDPCDLALDPQGNVFVATREGKYYEILKVDANGTLLWSHHETEKPETSFSHVAADEQGHCWLALTKGMSAQFQRVVLIRYGADGKRVVRKPLTRAADGRANLGDLLLDTEGNPVVTFRGWRDGASGWFTMKVPRPQRD